MTQFKGPDLEVKEKSENLSVHIWNLRQDKDIQGSFFPESSPSWVLV